MSIIIHPSHTYAFLSGLYVGKFTNFFSDIVITGLVLYIVTPHVFTRERFNTAKKYICKWFNPTNYISFGSKDVKILQIDSDDIMQNNIAPENKTSENITSVDENNKIQIKYRLPPLPPSYQ